jgi:hypothetical protein
MAAFTYATCTSRSVDSAAGATVANSRAVGTTPLRFTNVLSERNFPQAPDVFDLGDAAYGSNIVRYITAAGGVRPYSYSQQGLTPPALAANSSLMLGASGCLIGTVAAGTASPVRFLVTVGDSATPTPATLSGGFFITMYIAPLTMFRFGTDRINNGVVGQHYAAKLDTLGGYGAVKYTVVPNSLTVNGLPKGSVAGLEAIGLSLSSDGTIMGRPLESGPVSFIARAEDNSKRIARDRTDTVENQLVTFNIEGNAIAASDYTTISCRVKGDVGQVGKDSIVFRGYLNLHGSNFIALNGSKFMFFLGGAAFSGKLDISGRVVNDRGKPLVMADGSRVSIAINPVNGQIKGSITKTTLGKLLDGINVSDRSSKRYSVGVTVVNFIAASDMLEFSTRKNSNKFMLDYQLGKIGQPLGGAFQILSVLGTDKPSVSGQNGVAWKTKFLAIPRTGAESNTGMDAVSLVRVRICERFVQEIDGRFLTSSRGGGLAFQTKNFGETVSKLAYNSRTFVGSLQTQPLSVFVTGISQAKLTTTGANFTLGLDLDRSGANADFSGEVGKAITAYPSKGRWTDTAQHPR